MPVLDITCPVCNNPSALTLENDSELIRLDCNHCPLSLIGNKNKGDTVNSLIDILSNIFHSKVFSTHDRDFVIKHFYENLSDPNYKDYFDDFKDWYKENVGNPTDVDNKEIITTYFSAKENVKDMLSWRDWFQGKDFDH